MEKRRIGSLDVSVAGLGCNNFGWRIDAAAAAKVVDAAIDAGINFFDTADIYGGGRSEEFLGRALGSRRREIVLASKFGMKMDEQRREFHVLSAAVPLCQRLRECIKCLVLLIDRQQLGVGDTRFVSDFPANTGRLVIDANGYRTSIVNGEVLLQDGVHTGMLPGQILRR